MLSHLLALYVSHAHIIAFVLGALVGSFLNVVIHRLPQGLSIVRPRSHCPKCGDMIPGWLNVPIASWIVLRGKCRKCRAPISPRYPLVELLTALLFVAAVSRFGLSLATLAAILMSCGLIVITFVDIDVWEIPDEVSLPGIVIGAALRPFAFGASWYDGILGAAVGASLLALVRWFYFVVRKTEGMGIGDIKLIAMTGAFLGLRSLVPTILVASVAGTIIGGATLLLAPRTNDPGPGPGPGPDSDPSESKADEEGEGKDDEDDEDEDWEPPPHAVPFGPFLALGALAQLFLGDWISNILMRVFER